MKDITTAGNEHITHEQYYDLLKDANLFTGIKSAIGTVTLYYGKRVIITPKEVILFDHCEYCNGKDIADGLYQTTVCASCGAVIV